jgi:hypothetical protein
MVAKNKVTRSFVALIGLSLLLAGCLAPSQDSESHSPTLDLNALYTQVAGTLIAQGQQQPATATSGPTQTPIVITATPSFTPSQPTNTATNTSAPATNTAAVVCNQAAFVADVTVKDGTVMDKGEDFTKTWRIKNVGTCTWDKDDYTVIYSSGTNLAAKSSYAISEDVSPGETIDISVPMEAPDKNGSFTSNWVLRAGNGSTFGVGGSGSYAGVPFYVLIKVGSGGGGNNNNDDTDVRYDFAAHYCDAKWSSDTVSNLPCPGANSGDDGFVIVLQNPELEDRNEDEPAIWMRPNHDNSGFIEGVFPKITIKDDDRFVAEIGCLDNNANCRVQFTLSYIKGGNTVQLGTWDEAFEGDTTSIDINLSSLEGDEVRFVLTVEPNNNKYNQANAFWFQPQLINE